MCSYDYFNRDRRVIKSLEIKRFRNFVDSDLIMSSRWSKRDFNRYVDGSYIYVNHPYLIESSLVFRKHGNYDYTVSNIYN